MTSPRPTLARVLGGLVAHAPAGLLAALPLLMGGCTTPPLVIDTSHPSQGHASRVQFLVLHYTSEDEAHSLQLLTQGRVSSHYLVGDLGGDREHRRRPAVYRLVPEDRSAFHAGVSEWQGHRFINASSIGIEIVNAGWRDTPTGREWAPYPPEQVDAVVALVRDIVQRHDIRPDRVLAHSDIAPTRKQDPGPLFPWKRLADEGLLKWPDATLAQAALPGFEAQLPTIDWFQQQLARVGYGVPRTGVLDDVTRQVLQAFQMKYRPARYDGEPDAQTAALLQALTAP